MTEQRSTNWRSESARARVLAGELVEGRGLRCGAGVAGHAQAAAELLEAVERWDHVTAAGERLRQGHRVVDVQAGCVALRRGALVDRAGEPAGCRLVVVEPGRLPDRHALEVRPVRVGIAHALHDRQPLLARAAWKSFERRMQTDVVVDFLDVRRRDLDRRPLLSIFVVAIGDDGVQAVVAAVELDDDEDAAASTAVCFSSLSAAADRARKSGTVCPQASRAEEPRPRRIISRRVGCMDVSRSSELELGAIGEELKRLAQGDGAVVAGGFEREAAGVLAEIVLEQKIDRALVRSGRRRSCIALPIRLDRRVRDRFRRGPR